MRILSTGTLLVVTGLLLFSVPAYAQPFSDCGELVQGVTCVLFAASSGGEYLLEDTGGFVVGDVVLVTGELTPFCISICQQGDGCIFMNTIEPCIPGQDELVRGDADGDGNVSALIDGIFLLNFGFSQGDPPPCDDAGDADDDGSLNALIDGVYLFNFGFVPGSPPPPAPYPACGVDETDDLLDCAAPGACP